MVRPNPVPAISNPRETLGLVTPLSYLATQPFSCHEALAGLPALPPATTSTQKKGLSSSPWPHDAFPLSISTPLEPLRSLQWTATFANFGKPPHVLIPDIWLPFVAVKVITKTYRNTAHFVSFFAGEKGTGCFIDFANILE